MHDNHQKMRGQALSSFLLGPLLAGSVNAAWVTTRESVQSV